ncbi:TPA: DegT/DnrJ/EryC1/StrS family aminotransferase [Campylobacter jejuni]
MCEIEKLLSFKFNHENLLYTGSGTSALYLIFSYLKKQGKSKIAIPSLVCPQVSCAAFKAGCELVFIDVSLCSYTLDYESCVALYIKYSYDALVLVHLYGHFCDERIWKFCLENDIFIIEDCAQTYKIDFRAHASILSFGHTKFLENNSWGGVIFVYSKEILQDLYTMNEHSEFKDFKIFFEEYRQKYYALDSKDLHYFSKLKSLLLDYTLIFKAQNYGNLKTKLNNLEMICKNRREKMQIYQENLVHRDIIHPKLSHNCISWRYTFRYLGDRQKLLERLRLLRIDCSSWYIPSHRIFQSKILKNAEILSHQLINLWLDEKISKKEIFKNVDIIMQNL